MRLHARDCSLDAGIAERVLRDQFPKLAPHAVRYLGAGWDHDAYEVNGEWVMRMPMRAEVARYVPVEIGVLELVRGAFDLDVPRIELHGAPSELYPYPFTGYRKLAGEPAHRAPLADFASPANARTLGRMLATLHRISTARAVALGVRPVTLAEHRAADRAERVLARRAALDAALGPDLARRYAPFLAEHALLDADVGARRLCHDDMHLEHLLLDPCTHRVTGLIDWTDATLGDISRDFVLLWVDCGEPFV